MNMKALRDCKKFGMDGLQKLKEDIKVLLGKYPDLKAILGNLGEFNKYLDAMRKQMDVGIATEEEKEELKMLEQFYNYNAYSKAHPQSSTKEQQQQQLFTGEYHTYALAKEVCAQIWHNIRGDKAIAEAVGICDEYADLIERTFQQAGVVSEKPQQSEMDVLLECLMRGEGGLAEFRTTLQKTVKAYTHLDGVLGDWKIFKKYLGQKRQDKQTSHTNPSIMGTSVICAGANQPVFLKKANDSVLATTPTTTTISTTTTTTTFTAANATATSLLVLIGSPVPYHIAMGYYNPVAVQNDTNYLASQLYLSAVGLTQRTYLENEAVNLQINPFYAWSAQIYCGLEKPSLFKPQVPVENICLCPANWIYFNGSCYLLNTNATGLGYSQAESFCQTNYNAHLPSVHSVQEQNFIGNLLTRALVNNGSTITKRIWTGMSLRRNETIFGVSWSDGTTVDFGNPVGMTPGILPWGIDQSTGPNRRTDQSKHGLSWCSAVIIQAIGLTAFRKHRRMGFFAAFERIFHGKN